jgi:hypothetical protein
MSESLFHVLRVKVTQSQGTHSLVFDKILQGVEVLRILVLRWHLQLVPGIQQYDEST